MILCGRTRLFYSTDNESGEIEKLISTEFSQQHSDVSFVDGVPFYTYCDPGRLVFVFDGDPQVITKLFEPTAKINWIIELPSRVTVIFAGYILSWEQSFLSISMPPYPRTQVTVQVCGDVSFYSDLPTVPDTTPVFDKKASAIQAQTYAALLEKATRLTVNTNEAIRAEWLQIIERRLNKTDIELAAESVYTDDEEYEEYEEYVG